MVIGAPYSISEQMLDYFKVSQPLLILSLINYAFGESGQVSYVAHGRTPIKDDRVRMLFFGLTLLQL